MSDPMDNNGFDNNEEESFAQLFEEYESKSSRELSRGDMVEGSIISIGQKSVYIDTGTKSDGVVEKQELVDEDGQFPYVIGDKVKLYVVSLSESEIILSKAISGEGKANMLYDAFQNRTPVECRVTQEVKGGFAVDVLGKRAFCPVSQIDVKYVENQEEYVGQTFHFLITRFEKNGKNIVLSRRDLLNEQIKEQQNVFFKDVKEGDIVQGVITKLMPYGAFIELIPGLEGMAHISELSWSRIEKPEEILQPGDAVHVKLLKIDDSSESQTKKISLSIKQASDNPWESIGSRFNTGDNVTGRVVRLTSFGAFVEIAPGVDGLVHISEMSHTKRVLKPEDVVQKDDQVQVVIKSIDMDAKRISLSIKDALGDPWTGAAARYETGSVVQGVLEKRENFGLFINLEPGITGLMPASAISASADAAPFDRLKPGDAIKVMIQQVDENNRKITLTSPDQKDSDNWKQFADSKKQQSFGSMGELLKQALEKKK